MKFGMEMLTTDYSLCYDDGCARTMSAYDRGKFLRVYAGDCIRPERRGSRIEVQGARSGPGKRLCCLVLCPDELRIWLLAANAIARSDCDSRGASDWVSIGSRYTT
jgi:hypothetical protein